jgi:hypothetical protein
MKLTKAFNILAVLAGVNTIAADCTHGRLFVSDMDSANVYTYEIDGTSNPVLLNTLPTVTGMGPQFLYTSSTEGAVTVVYRGLEETAYQDGAISFIRVGVTPSSHEVAGFSVEKEDPSLVDDFFVSCARPIHHVAHDQKIAIFCDGSFEDSVNSTVWVVDERFFGQGNKTLVFSKTLEGSHHGVAVPVDEDHILVSVPTPERVANDPNASALPNGFHVYDYDMNLLHGLNEEEDPSRSCAGFHGSGVIDNTFVFACDQDHGGILVVDYGQAGVTYTSRALSYPDGFDAHRTGTLTEHRDSNAIVGNFADRATGDSKLVSFVPKQQSDEITEGQLLPLESGQCSFSFEQSGGNLILAWMPTGNLQVYAIEPEWMLLADIQVIDDMSSCDGTSMAPGQGHAYIMQGTSLIDVDLHDLTSPEISSIDLGFMPASAVVAGVPAGYACEAPSFPETSSTSAVDGWISIEQVLAPAGSAESTNFLRSFRNDIARSLGVGLNRVFVEETVKESDSSTVVHVKMSDPTEHDANPATGKQLLDQLIASGMSSATSVSSQAPSQATGGNGGGDSWPTGATVGIVLVAIVAIASIVAAVLFKKREKKALFDLDKANKGQSA